MQVAELQTRLQKRGLGIQLTTATKQYLLDHGYDAKNGVRPLRRLIQDTIEDQIATELLDEKYQKGDIIQVAARGGELAYETIAE
jgi:ATP-dependent Clp protease ATP-binding subunit ClpC